MINVFFVNNHLWEIIIITETVNDDDFDDDGCEYDDDDITF